MPRTRAMTLATLITTGTLALTACGSGSGSDSKSDSMSTAKAVSTVKASFKEAKEAKFFRVVADGTDGGEPLKFDLHYGSNGVDGSITTTGTTIAIKTLGDTVYFRAPSKFWREQGGAQGDLVAKTYGDKWVKTTASSEAGKGFGEFSNRSEFVDEFLGDFENEDLEGIKQVGKSSIAGVATTTFGDDTKEGTIDVAASGTPYLMRLISTPAKKSEDRGTVTLTEWDQAFTVQAPAKSVPLPS